MYDANQAEEEGAPPNFELIEDGSDGNKWWETQLQSSLATTVDNNAAANEGAAPPAASQMMEEMYFAADMPTSNGNMENGGSGGGVSTRDTTVGASHPAVEEAQKNTQNRIAEQSRKEAEQKAATQKKAADFLAKFYEERNKAREARARQLREEEEATKKPEHDGYQGSSAWEGALDFIDFNRCGATDLSRFKTILMTSKAKNS